MFNLPINILSKKNLPDFEYGKDKEKDLEYFLKECKFYLKVFNEEKVKSAFLMCHEAHKNRLRKSGKPYYTHPIEVARILLKEIALDDDSVISALLHDIPDEGEIFQIKDIRSEFGANIAGIVEGVHKIEHVESNKLSTTDQLENYRKLLLSLFTDVRIILVKLADRLHNMRTLEYLKPESRERLSRESLEVYAPFANRFGLRNIKWELEDLAFKYLNPTAYEQIKLSLNSTRKQREEYLQGLIEPIKEKLNKDELLKKNKVKFDIKGRPKHIYSIYNKMKARQKSIDELYDLFAVRVLLETDEENLCYYCYGLIASIFPPVPETFKDYIAAPKSNGYQSIHTALLGQNGVPFELQLRTVKMHNYAENGFAAHFRYKNIKVSPESILEDQNIKNWLDKVKQLFENGSDASHVDQLEYVKKNLFIDEIYIYTPRNEFRTLPKDSSPIDFAFSIHSEVGFKYLSAKVNGKIVPISHKLQSGDQVEIITSDNIQPKEEWLNHVVTSKARSFLKKWLKENNKKLIEEGREIWEKECQEMDLENCRNDIDSILNYFKFNGEEEFFIAVVNKEIDIRKAIQFLKYKLSTMSMRQMKLESENTNKNQELQAIQEQNKIVNIELKIIAHEEKTSLSGITNSIIDTNIADLNAVSYDIEASKIHSFFNLSVENFSSLSILIDDLAKLDGIISVEKINNKVA